MAVEPSQWQEEDEEDGQDRDVRFDPMAHYQSRQAEPRSVRRLPGLVAAAVRLAHGASPRLFWLNATVQLVSTGVLALQVLLGKLALEQIISRSQDGGSIGGALPPLIGLVAATAIGSLAMSSQAQLQRLLGEYVQRRTWGSILDVSTSVGLESFEDPDFFDDLQRARTNAIIQPLTLAQGLVELVGGLFGVVGLSIAVVVIDPVLLPLILIGGLPLFLISRRQGHIEFAFNVTQTPALRVRHYMTEVLTGRDEAKEVRAFGLGGFLRGRWASLYDTYIEDFRVHVRRRLLLAALGSLVTIVVTSVTFGLLVYLVLDDQISLASAGAAFIAIRLLATQIGELFNGVSGLFESSLFLRDLDRFLERRPPPEPDDAAVGSPDAVRPFSALRAEGLRFRYPGGQHDVLKGIDLTINAGEVVALVGENGSGKTTLAKLLGQLYEATGGRILWDGRDTRELPRTALRRQIGLIFQDFIHYQLTARENIGLGLAEEIGDEARLEAAAARGGADHFIAGLPEGYETILGKAFAGGWDLSLGQWQRIALARAFFRDAPFLVLDEPTASLDPRSENDLFEHVRSLAAGRAILLISHRFSTVKSADRIYVIHEGELTESGTHEELMAAGRRYAELFTMQAAAYR